MMTNAMTSTSLPAHDALVGLFAAGDEAFGCAREYGLGQLARVAATGRCRFRYEEGQLVGAALVDGSQLLLAVAPGMGTGRRRRPSC